MEISCPLCQAPDADTLFVKQGIAYHRCIACRFTFSTPATNANFPPSFASYEVAYQKYFAPDAPARQHELQARFDWIRGYRNLAGSQVLDVGCGSGAFVRFLREQGVEADGLEPSSALYEHYLKHEPYFMQGEVASLADMSRQYDIITLCDVLEHVPNPVGFMRALGACCKPTTLLFLSLPDAGSLMARLLKKQWHYHNAYHYSYFNRTTLEQLAHMTGYTIKSTSHRARYQSVGFILSYFKEFLLHRQEQASSIETTLDSWIFPVNLFDVLYVVMQAQRE